MASQEIVNMCGYGVLIKFYFSGLMWLDMHTIDLGHSCSCFENELTLSPYLL